MKRLSNKKQFLMALILGSVLCTGISANATTIDAKPENGTTQTTVNAVQPEKDANGNILNGWDSSKKYYYKDGVKVKGFQWVEDSLYYFYTTGKSAGSLYTKKGLREINGKNYYVQRDYSLATGVCDINGKAYYFDTENGQRIEKTGIVKLNKSYYCFDEDYSLESGWRRNRKNKRYYFDKDTYAALTGWKYVGKYKFYFKKNGQLQQDVRKYLSRKQKSSYVIRVNRKESCVTVYAKDGKKGYTIPVVAFVCSAGKRTPKGTFKIKDKLRWHELDGPSWGQWCEHLTTEILFHSVYYDRERDNKSLNVKAYNKLGKVASHGCIRLRAGDAKWIYDNCDIGTKVIIYDNKKVPGPFDKPKAQKLSSSHTWDPTDPAFKKKK